MGQPNVLDLGRPSKMQLLLFDEIIKPNLLRLYEAKNHSPNSAGRLHVARLAGQLGWFGSTLSTVATCRHQRSRNTTRLLAGLTHGGPGSKFLRQWT